MAFTEFAQQEQGLKLLQRSLERGRLAHAYLFTGHRLEDLETLARTLAKTLNCRHPVRAANGAAIDSCDRCPACLKVDQGGSADLHWMRPESRSRVITVEQLRGLIQEINLKPTESEYKVAIIVAADRLHPNAANAFLKTLEEPPPKSILILLTSEPQRVLPTLVSRCLRLNFTGDGPRPLTASEAEWLATFSDLAAAEDKSLFNRYRLLDALLQRLNATKAAAEDDLTKRSPLSRFDDAEKDMREQWEDELSAAIESEYRRQRAELLAILHRWLRDIWLWTLTRAGHEDTLGPLLNFPELSGPRAVARRLAPPDALENLQIIEDTQRLLHTNVQEALALEVGLLKLRL